MHSLSPCYGLVTALVLLNSVARWCDTNTIFYKNVVILHACVHGLRKEFFQGGHKWIFQKFFYGGPKVVKFVFWHSKLRKQYFLLKFSNSCPSSDTHMLVYRKSSCHTIKYLGNFKRFNTTLNSVNFTESYTQNEIFDRSISIACLYLYWQR